MSFSIITDTTANLKKSLLKLYGVKTIAMPYYINEKENYCEDIDAFDDEKYYNDIKSGLKVNTSQINPAMATKEFEKELIKGRDVLFIGLSSGVSGSFKSAQIAAQELSEKYPNRKILLLDSLGASLGIGLCVLYAVEFKRKGLSIEETFKKVEEIRDRIYQVFIVDDLMHLKRTGRLSNVSAAVGTVLGIKPILKGSSEGTIVATDKIRGRKQAVKALGDKCINLIKDAKIVGITYAGCKEDAQSLAEYIKKSINIKRLIMEKHEPVTGAHIGPGALALYFVGGKGIREV